MKNDNPPNELYVIEESDALGIGSGSWGISKHPGGGLRVAGDPDEADSLMRYLVSIYENKRFRCVKYVSA